VELQATVIANFYSKAPDWHRENSAGISEPQATHFLSQESFPYSVSKRKKNNNDFFH